MIKNILLLSLFFLGINFLSAQEEQELKLNREIDFGMFFGFDWQFYDALNAEQWNKATPGSINADEIDPTLESNYQYNSSVTAMPGFSFSFNLDKNDKKPSYFSRFIRISYQSGKGFSADKEWTKNTSYAYDTLTSGLTGQTYFIDSVVTENYSKRYNSSQRQLNLTFIYQTDRTKRFSYYTGFGLGLGISKRTYSEALHTVNYNLNSTDANVSFTSNTHSSPSEISNSKNQLKNNSSFQIYLPVGMELKLSKKSTFLSKFVINAELGFAYNWYFIKELGTFKNQSTRLMFGVKYRF